jgi:hypothetical protein
MPEDLELVVIDVDGCLTPGEAGGWNWAALKKIRDLNRLAAGGRPRPAITLCTGRQEPYVEVLMQAIGACVPCIYENGCGLYYPDGYRFAEHPSITTATREALATSKALLYREVVMPGRGYFQPGKEASITLYPLPGTGVGELFQLVEQALVQHRGAFAVQASVSCVDVMPQGIDKGLGVRWLCEEMGIPLARVGGIGDSTSDLKFLRLVARSAAPANATAQVKAEVDYVSPYDTAGGVLDILDYWDK